MDRANKKFNLAAKTSLVIGVVSIVAGVACGVLSILCAATIFSGKKEMEF